MKILITGAGGFIGRYLTHELRIANYDVIGIDYPDGNLAESGVAHRIIEKHRPDIVVHLAAKTGRLFGEKDPMVTISSNAIATVYVAQACTKFNSRLVYISTSEIFGDSGRRWVMEHEKGSLPYNLYGLSKRWGEEVGCLYAKNKLQILRLSMPYGPGLPAGWGYAAIMTFLWYAHNRKSLTVHRGGCRCWIWIGDLIAGMRMIIEDAGIGVWSVGRDDNETTMLDVARRACSLAKAPLDLIQEVEPPANVSLVKRLKIGRLTALGWIPKVDLQTGMIKTYEAIKLYNENGMPPPNWRSIWINPRC